MAASNTAKPATAQDGEPASNCEQLGGQLKLENALPDDTLQPETALAAAFREAARWKAVAASVLIGGLAAFLAIRWLRERQIDRKALGPLLLTGAISALFWKFVYAGVSGTSAW